MSRRPNFDYDSDEFYEEVFSLAMQGMADGEIADALADRFGQRLEPDTFGAMKNGTYPGWDAETNARRGERLRRVLSRARRKTNAIVRGAYLKAALGGRRLKGRTTVTRHQRDENGDETGVDEIQTTESETELGPNLQALATWLHHHDPEWRRMERGGDVDEDIPEGLERGVDIEAWLLKEVEAAGLRAKKPEEGEEGA